MRLLRALSLGLLLAAACGSDDEPSLPRLEWTWVPVAGTACSDGSETGMGIERGPGPSPDVLVFLMGGGACWDALTCFPPLGLPQIATPGPYGADQLAADIRTRRPGSILDRELPGNPYKDFTFVFVPYCTGDVHAGDAVRSYPGAPRAWHHRGRANLQLDFARLPAEVEAPARVVVSGSSAGGFGALLAFDLAKTSWPAAKGYLVDDSGPPLDEIPPLTVAAWLAQWELGDTLVDVCGGLEEGLACAQDLGSIFPVLGARYPEDRLALLSSTQDEVMRFFFGTFVAAPPFVTAMAPETFEQGVRALAGRIEDDTPANGAGETHAFVVTGTTHPMLDRPASFSSQGVGLLPWLGQMLADDPAWASAIPP